MAKYLLIISLIAGVASARNYSNDELDRFHSSPTNQTQIRNFVESFNFKNPDLNLKSVTSELLKDAQHFAVLNKISQSPESPQNRGVLEALKNYQPKAFKKHDEGELYMPVFNFEATIKGIENQWSSARIEKTSYKLLSSKSDKSLKFIEDIYRSGHLGNIYGIKSAVSSLSIEKQKYWSEKLHVHSLKTRALQSFAMDFSLKTLDRSLVNHLLSVADKNVKQNLLRHLSQFDEDFQLQELKRSSEDPDLTQMSLSLMKPFVNRVEDVKNHLFERLKQGRQVHSVAFALSGLTDYRDMGQLKSIYFTSHSHQVRAAIMTSLKINKSVEAKALLAELTVKGEVK